jgi:hypothetical protein
MASDQQVALQVRHGELMARSGALRERLGMEAQVLRKPLALADRIRAGGQWLAARPLVTLAVAALLVVMRPRRSMKWAMRLWWVWRTARRVQALLAR